MILFRRDSGINFLLSNSKKFLNSLNPIIPGATAVALGMIGFRLWVARGGPRGGTER